MPKFSKIDIYFCFIVAFFAALSVYFYTKDVGLFFFYQTWVRAPVAWACGREFSETLQQIPAVTHFTTLQAPTLDCSVLANASLLERPVSFTYSHWYLAWSTALLWRLNGLNQAALWPLAATLHVGFSLASLLLARLFLPRLLAIFVGLAIAVSPVAISMLFLIRDYSKAPFIAFALVTAISAMRASSTKTAYCWCALTGIILGIGMGFRVDVAGFVPIAILSLAIGLEKLQIRFRAVALSILCVGFFVSGSPVILNGIGGSYGTTALQGTTNGFQRHLQLELPPYDVGTAYSDELTISAISAELREKDPAVYDASEPEFLMGLSQGMSRASGPFLEYVRHFPADVMMRGLKASFLATTFFPLLSPEARAEDPNGGPKFPASTLVAQVTSPLWQALDFGWLPFVIIAGLWLLVVQAYARSPYEALALAIMFLAISGMTSLQFSLRHAFHLEPIAWIGLFAAISAPWNFRVKLSTISRFLAVTAIACTLAALVLTAARYSQAEFLRSSVAAVLDGTRLQVRLEQRSIDKQVLFPVPVPERYKALVDGPPDSFTRGHEMDGTAWNVRAGAIRLIVTLTKSSGCQNNSVDLKLIYQHTKDTWQPFDRTLTVDLSEPDNSAVRVIIPAFYRPTQFFEGIALDHSSAACITGIEVSEIDSPLPVLFSARVGSDWQTHPLFLKFGRL